MNEGEDNRVDQIEQDNSTSNQEAETALHHDLTSKETDDTIDRAYQQSPLYPAQTTAVVEPATDTSSDALLQLPQKKAKFRLNKKNIMVVTVSIVAAILMIVGAIFYHLTQSNQSANSFIACQADNTDCMTINLGDDSVSTVDNMFKYISTKYNSDVTDIEKSSTGLAQTYKLTDYNFDIIIFPEDADAIDVISISSSDDSDYDIESDEGYEAYNLAATSRLAQFTTIRDDIVDKLTNAGYSAYSENGYGKIYRLNDNLCRVDNLNDYMYSFTSSCYSFNSLQNMAADIEPFAKAYYTEFGDYTTFAPPATIRSSEASGYRIGTIASASPYYGGGLIYFYDKNDNNWSYLADGIQGLLRSIQCIDIDVQKLPDDKKTIFEAEGWCGSNMSTTTNDDTPSSLLVKDFYDEYMEAFFTKDSNGDYLDYNIIESKQLASVTKYGTSNFSDYYNSHTNYNLVVCAQDLAWEKMQISTTTSADSYSDVSVLRINRDESTEGDITVRVVNQENSLKIDSITCPAIE